MKKSLSLLLAIALVFGMFYSVAAAATTAPTPAEAGQALKEYGIIQGSNGDLMEDSTWLRQDAVVLLSRLLKVEDTAKAHAKTHGFTDVKGSFYDGYISWAKEEGYIKGNNAAGTTFGFGQTLTNQQFATIVLRVFGVDDYANAVAKGIEFGILPAGATADAPAKRGDTFVGLVAALNHEVPGLGKTLGAHLGLPGFNVELAVAKAAQSGAKKITVDFNRALTADEATALKASVKNGLVPYPVTVTPSEDKKSAVLEATFLPAAEYDVVINEFPAVKVTVINAFVNKVEIGANALQAAAGQALGIKVFNNFNEDVTKAESVQVTVISSKNGNISTKYDSTNGNLDLSGEAVDNTVVVSVTHTATGVVASKTYKLVAGSSATNIVLGAVAPKKDETRIYVSTNDYVLPITLKDQYGAEFKLPASTTASAVYGVQQIGGISIVSSDAAIIDPASFETNSDSALMFDTKAKSGTVILTISNYATGAYATVAVKVEDRAALKSFQISSPAVLVVNGEDVVIPYVAADTFGAPIANKDVPGSTGTLTFTANGAPIAHKFKANGDLVLNFTTTGSTFVMALVNGVPASNITLDVKAPAYPVSIVGTKDLKTTLAVYGSQTVDASKLLIRDNYGRTKSALPANSALTVVGASGNGNTTDVAGTDSATITGAIAGTEEYTVTLSSTLGTPAYTAVVYKLTFTTIAIADVKTVTIGTVGTLFDNTPVVDATAYPGDYSKTLELTGKNAAGTDVAVRASDFFNLVTSSDESIVGVTAPTTSLNIFGKGKGTAVVTVWKDGVKLNEQTVTVSDVNPVITTVKFANAEETLAGTAGTKKTVTPEVKDQYGVALPGGGKYYSSDVAKATVDANTGEVTKVANGIVTITYVAKNGIVATYVLNVENA